MKTKIFSLLYLILAPVLSGVLLFLAFPNYNAWWFAWIGLAPLLVVISGRGSMQGFLLSFICGLVFFAGVFDWMLETDGYEILHHSILVFGLALYFGIFGLALTFLIRRAQMTVAFLAAPFLWIALEYIRGKLFFLALPWAFLGHTQYQNISLIQISAITGAYGVSFLVVLVNSAVALLILGILNRLGWQQITDGNFPSRRGIYVITLGAAVLMTLALLYGNTLSSERNTQKSIKVSVLQGNIEQSKKWDPKYAGVIMQTYGDLSRKAARDNPDLIIWPEAATPGFILKKLDLMNQTISLVKELKTYFIIGSSEFPKFDKDLLKAQKTGNTALFFSPDGKILGQYLKIYLFPFSEYVPYEGIIPWPQFIVPDKKSSHVAGKEFTLFNINNASFGVLICWETIFPDLFRQYIKEGAQFMVNIGNEAWFGKSAGPNQFLSINIFRAIENRVFMVRCNNTGISCFIDPYGRVVDRVRSEEGQDIFVRGMLTGEVIPLNSNTIYTRHGDWLVWLSIGVSLIFLLIALLRKTAVGNFRTC